MEGLDKSTGKKGKDANVVFAFSVWWFDLSGDRPSYQAPEFRAMLGKAKRLRQEGFDLDLVKRTILTMIAQGIRVETPYAIKWASPHRNQNWYDYSNGTLPPMWDGVTAKLYSEGIMPLRVS